MNNKKCGIICTLRKRQRKKITFILYQVDRETRRVLVSSEQTGRTRKKYPLNVTILVRQHPFSCVPLPCNFQFSPRPPTAQLFLFSVFFSPFACSVPNCCMVSFHICHGQEQQTAMQSISYTRFGFSIEFLVRKNLNSLYYFYMLLLLLLLILLQRRKDQLFQITN